MSNKLKKKTKNVKKETNMTPIYAGICGVFIILALLILILGRRSGNSSKIQDEPETELSGSGTEADVSQVSGPVATIVVKGYGDIVVQLDEETAPITVENFVTLAENGFYNGLTFHRIIDGFMIQGGDPLGNGTGGSENTIKGEFSANGVDNSISHKRGVISMARSNDMDSASSQFFIVQSDSLHLDGSYAGFGYVTSGMDIVDQICKDTPVQDSNGTVNAEDQPVIESITIKKE